MTAVVNTKVPKWMPLFLFSSSFFPSFLPSLISMSSCHLTFAASRLVPYSFLSSSLLSLSTSFFYSVSPVLLSLFTVTCTIVFFQQLSSAASRI